MRTEEFYAYLQKRENIRILKEAKKFPPPWTDDSILHNFKFTNVKRINDRTTRHFAQVYRRYSGEPEAIALYNAAMYRYFGTIAWQEIIGWSTKHEGWLIRSLAEAAIGQGESIFTGAYVITNGGRAEPKHLVVEEYLSQLFVDAATIVNAIEETKTWEAGYDQLRQLPGFGGSGFMAKEVLQDYLIWLGYRNDLLHKAPVEEYITDFWDFTPLGPGARRGLNRVLSRGLMSPVPLSTMQGELGALRQAVSARFAQEFGVRLSAHDVQFCLCEFDKYERARLGEGRPRSRYYPRSEQ